MGRGSFDDGPLRRLQWLAAGSVALVAGAVVLAACLVLFTSPHGLLRQQVRPRPNSELVAPYVATPIPVVKKMLELARVTSADTVYDLGSGDGRIVIAAAQKFGARAVGVELDDKLARESSERLATLGLRSRASILHANLFSTDLRPATVVTLFLWKDVNERLRPFLEKGLKPGTRIVSHDFAVPGWRPAEVADFTTPDGVSHKIYLYVRPPG